MRRYIDADALGIGKANRDVFEHPQYADGWNSAIEIINNAPTADVAPKIEVAMEIFEEIEKLFLNNHIESFQNFHDEWVYRFKPNTIAEYTELKKKYTEVEQ